MLQKTTLQFTIISLTVQLSKFLTKTYSNTMNLLKKNMNIQDLIQHAENALNQGNTSLSLEYWERIRKNFPSHPQGYIRAGFVALKAGNTRLAESLADQAMDKFPHAVNAFILSAEISMRRGDYEQALSRWERVQKSFPSQPQGYIQAGFTAMKLGRLALAESLAIHAMKEFPKAVNAFLLSAEIAMRSGAFDTALSRWERVRQLFPLQPQGYIQAGFAALEVENIPLAESLALQALNKFPDADNAKKLHEKIIDTQKYLNLNQDAKLSDLIDIADKDMTMGLFRQAFVHFRLAMKNMPLHPRPFIGAAEAAIKMRQYRRAENICKEIIARFPLHIEGYKIFIHSLEDQGYFERALEELKNIQNKFPQNPYGWLKYAEIQLKAGDADGADASIRDAIKLFPENVDIFLFFAQIPAAMSDKIHWQQSIERYKEACDRFPSSYQTYYQALSNYCKAITLNKNIITQKINEIYFYIFKKFLTRFMQSKETNFPQKKLEPCKIAFYVQYPGELKFFLPVIKYLSPDLVDIVFGNRELTPYIKEFSLEGYKIFFNKNNLDNYKYVIMDIFRTEDFENYEYNIIGYMHSTDSAISSAYLNKLSLAILASKNQMTTDGVFPCPPSSDGSILPAHADYTCEICYTGPYHLETFLERRHDPKNTIKEELAEKLGIDIPTDKPIVFMLEDEFCHIGQLSYAANNMAQYATVFYKTFLPPADPRLLKFNNTIHIIRAPFAPNLLRFSADYICCGYLSGSFTTSVMLGQNVLPYYSRIIEKHNKRHPDFTLKRYNEYFETLDQTPPPTKLSVYLKFYNEGKLLDLVDSAAFKNAILGKEYQKWYQSILPELQKEAFGDYVLEGAPQKTADYIMRFVKDGTLGKDCSAIYLKERYFRAFSV